MKYKYLILLVWLVFNNYAISQHNYPEVLMRTDYGSILVRLDPINAPITVDNFLTYVNYDFYNNSIIHRVDNNPTYSVIQGGLWALDQSGNLYQRSPIKNIINESYNGLSNTKYTIAMARQGHDPNSANSQFYFNQNDNIIFDKQYYPDGFGFCVFGEIVKGMWLVDAISAIEPNDFLFDENDPYTYSLEQLPYPPLIVFNEVTALPCDVTYCVNYVRDSVIDFKDYSAFASQYGAVDCNSFNFFCSDTDLDFNGEVGISDLAIFMEIWLLKVGSEPVLSDFNQSGMVSEKDLDIFSLWWLTTDCGISNSYCDGTDLNQDGRVDFWDFALFANNWLVPIP